ncbi:hypothetical protein Tco_0231857 [Tanacetum coccineum]
MSRVVTMVAKSEYWCRLLVATMVEVAWRQQGWSGCGGDVDVVGVTGVMVSGDWCVGKSQGASTPEEVMHMQRVPYALAIGSIMYVMRCTRPDVAFTEKDDRKSKSGYVFVLNGGAIDCKTAKQSTIVMSSTEVEYITALEAAMEVVWMRNFIDGLGVVPTNNEPMEMLCDNTSTIPIANEPNVIKGARHYQRKFHCIREVIKFGEIVLNKSIYEDSVFNQAY